MSDVAVKFFRCVNTQERDYVPRTERGRGFNNQIVKARPAQIVLARLIEDALKVRVPRREDERRAAVQVGGAVVVELPARYIEAPVYRRRLAIAFLEANVEKGGQLAAVLGRKTTRLKARLFD